MTKLGAWLKLIRLPNLLIMLFSFYLIRIIVAEPFADSLQISLLFSPLNFLLLVLVTLFTAAAGNIVNDIYDLEIDLINKPKQTIIGRVISKKHAWTVYHLLNVISCLLIFKVYASIDWFLAWMYPFGFFLTSLLLWYYSASLKKKAIVGNLVISLFVCFVPWSICFPEIVEMLLGRIPRHNIFLFTSLLYILFAFLSNFLREIIKDLEDQEGDAMHGARTLPIKYGAELAKKTSLITALILSLIISFAIVQLLTSNLFGTAIFALLTVLLPLVYLCFKLPKATNQKTFHALSSITKVIMISGLLALVVLYFEFYSFA